VSRLILCRRFFPANYFARTGEHIASVQLSSGAVPWYEGGILDPWDHIESAMGLAVAGYPDRARLAYDWCARNQLPDGSFWPAYADSTPLDCTRREAHHSAYLATGLWHYYLVSGDRRFLARMWPAVRMGLDFACGLQTKQGEISWARLPCGGAYPDALVTGCSSIYKSLECGLNMATVLGKPGADWAEARHRLGRAIRDRGHRFDRTWPTKERYAMDWFYPVLSGVFAGDGARRRLMRRWSAFVEPGQGCRCVEDEPWITVAESCELVLSLLCVGASSRACRIFNWLQQHRCAGNYWTGYQRELNLYWPRERPTWTAAAVLLAADALFRATPAAGLFTDSPLAEPEQKASVRDGCGAAGPVR
jgi:hypothetical protein